MFLLRFILLLILFYLVIQIIGRLLFGAGKRNTDAYTSSKGNRQRRREGDVHVDFDGNKKQKIISKDEGEYINYEEVDDNEE